MSNMVVSNIRFPKDEWLQLKSAASAHQMSVNEYLRFVTRTQTARQITALIKKKPKHDPYQAMADFIDFVKNNNKIDKPMGLSDEDKAIYDP
jgi:Ni,Fe-hydrogenase maturation factor